MLPECLATTLEQRVAAAITPREAAVDVMKELQRHYGWLTDEAVGEAAHLLGLSPLQVEELATFYEMIYRRPVGRHVVQVCDSVSCWALGGGTLLETLKQHLRIEVGATSADGLVTLLPCSCRGNCGEAPCMAVDETVYGRLTPETALQVLATLRTCTAAGEND